MSGNPTPRFKQYSTNVDFTLIFDTYNVRLSKMIERGLGRY